MVKTPWRVYIEAYWLLNVWIISDGKPGHLNQSLGLVEAMQRLKPEAVRYQQLPPLSVWQALPALLTGKLSIAVDELPDLVVGAGHSTHLSLLAVGRATGAKTVVLMSPSLPLGCFDLALIPEHDNPKACANVIPTVGALNRMLPAKEKRPDSGMLLIGGPSKHFVWDESQVLEQVGALIKDSRRHWLLTTSRRTPDSFLTALAKLDTGNVDVVPFAETDAKWLVKHLPEQQVCWVTNDSVSMIYEALSAGCRVGVVELPHRAENRIVTGISHLISRGLVATSNDAMQATVALHGSSFNEAQRCAQELIRLLER
ncbi:MAG: ELM1/GtrOC1 family putative glycosyltransferase [Amphritea sp.]